MTDKQQLQQYAALKKEIKKLAKEVEEIQPEILEIVEKMNPVDKTVEMEEGTFVIASKRKYTYPLEIIEAEEKLEEAKKAAQARGDATYEVTEYLKFEGI